MTSWQVIWAELARRPGFQMWTGSLVFQSPLTPFCPIRTLKDTFFFFFKGEISSLLVPGIYLMSSGGDCIWREFCLYEIEMPTVCLNSGKTVFCLSWMTGTSRSLRQNLPTFDYGLWIKRLPSKVFLFFFCLSMLPDILILGKTINFELFEMSWSSAVHLRWSPIR